MDYKNNRRQFLKRSLLATGGAIIGSSFPLTGKNLFFGKEKLKVGIIGTGSRGTGLINLMNEIEGMEVAACCDIIPFRLKDGVSLAPTSRGYSHHHDLLTSKEVDAVIIATPFSSHASIAIDALKEGKHVYCEKTMVKGINEIQEVLDVKSQNNHLVFQTGHQYHSSPLYNKVRDMIKAGYIGEVTSFECQWNRNGSWRRPVPDPKWERMINWRMYKEYSGGLTAELASHQIDFINWVTESHPSRISGFGGIDHYKDGRETYDNIHLIYEYPSGMDASFTCTTTNGFGDYGIRILGSKATIDLDYTFGIIYGEKANKDLGLVDGVSGATIKAWEEGKGIRIEAPGNDPTVDALMEFYDSIVNKKPVKSDVITGGLTSKCVHISLDALYSGTVKHWAEYPELVYKS